MSAQGVGRKNSALRSYGKRSLAALGLLLLVLLAALVARASLLRSSQLAEPALEPRPVDAARVAGILARAIQLPTVSYEPGTLSDPAAFAALENLLAQSFPLLHARLSKEKVGAASLLFTWVGSDPGLAPVVLCAHQDVVPVEPGTEGGWEHPPFSGAIADGFVWGRGALDDKGGLVTLLEGLEQLAAQGFEPRRTVMVFLDHDEEAMGSGAAAFAARLEAQGVKPFLVLDEWMPIVVGGFPGIDAPVAMVRVAEKAYLTVELSAEATGGHSSMPPRETAVGLVARAVARLEANPLPARLDGAARETFIALAPEMSFSSRLVMANLWLFEPLLKRRLAASPATDAWLRTTTAATVISGGVKDNVLPARARALVNFRLLPGDSVAAVLAHIARVIDDSRVKVTAVGQPEDPRPPSVVSGEGYRAVARTLRQVAPDTLVAPGLLVGTSDARFYQRFSDQVFGFRPFHLKPEDYPRFHGTNERVAIADLELAVRFFTRLVEVADGG